MSHVDEFITRLHAAIDETLIDRQVLDGWMGEDLDHRIVAVGFDSSQGNSPIASVTITEDESYGTIESIVVACTASSWDGDMDIAGKRRQVAADLAAIRSRLVEECRASKRLGGLVLDVMLIPSEQWYVVTDDRGPSVQCDFVIRGRVHA
jgi:hypothetical protein